MTLKTRNGFVAGTRQQPTISITVFDDAGATLNYNNALAAAINVAPATIFNAPLNTFDVSVSDRSRSAIQFEFSYKRTDALILTRRISAATKPKKLYNFLSSVGVFDSTGDVTSSYTALKTKLDRQGGAAEFNGGSPRVIEPLSESRTLSYTTTLSLVTDAYLALVETLVNFGAFNNATFLGNAIGSLQLVSFSAAEQVDGSWVLEFGMGFKAFVASFSVGDGIFIPELRGCDYWWPVEGEVYVDSKVQSKTKAVVVGEVFPFADFSQLKLPWQGTLTTRTNDTTGVVTTVYEHNIAGAVAVYWEGGFRISANVTGSTAFTVTFSSGSGDALPPVGTRVLAADM